MIEGLTSNSKLMFTEPSIQVLKRDYPKLLRVLGTVGSIITI